MEAETKEEVVKNFIHLLCLTQHTWMPTEWTEQEKHQKSFFYK